MLSASDDLTYRIWDLCTGRCVQVVEAHEHFVLSMAWGRQTVISEISGSRSSDTILSQRTINVLATGSNDKVWIITA